MTRPLIIFGTGPIAELAYAYFTEDSPFSVVAFTVNAEFIENSKFCDLPVVPFEDVKDHFAPSEYAAFVAVSYTGLNAVRKEKYLALKALGYDIASYVSSRASVLNGQDIGENCFILEDNTIQNYAKIGNNVTLWSGNHIGHHSRIGDHTFISSHVVVSGGVAIGEQCFLGVNSTIRDGIKVGDRCLIGAGALILADAEADGAYVVKGTERSRVPSSRLRNI